ncbi:hypothetical protein NI18_20420 [Sphingomonas sp. Ant20]|nr:hypothetical protein NI18_20420 [Sphingomonas sp. Ant20]
MTTISCSPATADAVSAVWPEGAVAVDAGVTASGVPVSPVCGVAAAAGNGGATSCACAVPASAALRLAPASRNRSARRRCDGTAYIVLVALIRLPLFGVRDVLARFTSPC